MHVYEDSMRYGYEASGGIIEPEYKGSGSMRGRWV